ncbi:Paf1 complex protein [Neohortaea acidophila]|uniref:Paf1 complex protein n=1 Tax=Neohortaea acidophila TaxID=245834 RepID=A0A6A6Q6X6_9PEZI|nr:Paf1 complex protein [Neohortaea acidophila]KAF2487779.1 Paf1 complex protein [Neohortaea acidophila]
MASSRQSGQVVHQDYIARVRYDNSLPPPSLPPKFLDIPGTGLAGADYTSAGYASRMAKEQPLNIEADAELGMPIDLVGIPGVFDGDERAILARPGPIKLHPADKELLKPLGALGKGAAIAGSVSFLRRTEYTSSQGPQQFTSSTSKDLLRLRNDPKRRKTSMNKDDPINIIRNVIKGFDIAYPRDAYKGEDSTTNIQGAKPSEADAKAWTNPQHPSKPSLQLLDSYPVLPDLDALPSTACFMLAKFITNPLASSRGYDHRLDAAILRQKNDEQAYARWNHRNEEWKQSSSTKPQPIPEDDYEYFVPLEATSVRSIKRKLDVNDPEHDDDELYTDDGPDGRRLFKYSRLRTYETYQQSGDPASFYDDHVALALHDPDETVGAVPGMTQRLQKGAYFYPIMQRTSLRPKRNVGQMAFSQAADDEKIDELDVTVADVDEALREAILEKRAVIDPSAKADLPAAVEAAA